MLPLGLALVTGALLITAVVVLRRIGGQTRRFTAPRRPERRCGTAHQILVYDDQECVGWCQYGTPGELPNIKNAKAYERELINPPDWRIGCIFTGKGYRRIGVARAAVAAVLDVIKQAGGGWVEAYPEQVEGRAPQQGAYFHTGPQAPFEEFGFERDRRIAKWRWVIRAFGVGHEELLAFGVASGTSSTVGSLRQPRGPLPTRSIQ